MALVTVFGGTGFLGSRIVEHLAGVGEIVRVAACRPERLRPGLFPAGSGRAVSIAADLREEKSLVAVVARVEGVVNAVSAYAEKGDVTYTGIYVQGALNVARACNYRRPVASSISPGSVRTRLHRGLHPRAVKENGKFGRHLRYQPYCDQRYVRP
jgi:uncharacterized protein YbjT (DUF2867 family)